MNTNIANIRPQLLTKIQNITLKDIILPTIPIDIYLQEIENLAVWAIDDLSVMNNVGINIEHIEDLKERIDTCRILQTEWLKLKKIKPDIQKEWEKVKLAAITTRNELIFTYKYALRNNDRALNEVKQLNKKNTAAELVSTLNDLCRIGKKYCDLLESTSFDFSQLDTSKNLGIKVKITHSEYIADTPEKDKIKSLRDRSYTYLKLLADEIKAAGKFIFVKNTERLKGYEIAYYKKKKAHLKANADGQ